MIVYLLQCGHKVTTTYTLRSMTVTALLCPICGHDVSVSAATQHAETDTTTSVIGVD